MRVRVIAIVLFLGLWAIGTLALSEWWDTLDVLIIENGTPASLIGFGLGLVMFSIIQYAVGD